MDTSIPSTLIELTASHDWTLAGGPFDADPSVELGSAVSIDGDKMCSGAPSVFQGYLDCFVRSNLDEWVGIQQIAVDASSGARFGNSVQILGSQMIVGAPNVFAQDTFTPTGVAYLFEFNEQLSRWDLLGAEVRGDEDIFSANEEFGASVSIAENSRIAIGAPMNNLEMRIGVGRVYSFSRQQGVSVPLQQDPLLGQEAGDLFGTSVALSSDGSRLLVGAPGDASTTTGYAVLYEWNNDNWEMVESFIGSQGGEGFGTEVVMLSRTGNIFAIGSPGYDGGAGRILVYEQAAIGFQVLGGSILGGKDDRLGDIGTFDGDGDGDNSIVSLLVGTAGGTVRRYDFNRGKSTWEVLYEELEFSNSITSLSTTSSADVFVVGEAAISQTNIFIADQDDLQAAVIPTQTPLSPSFLETRSPSKVPSQANVDDSDTMGTSSPSASIKTPEVVPTATPSVARTSVVVKSYEDRFQRNSVIWITAFVVALAVLLAIIIFQQFLIMEKNNQLNAEDALYVVEDPQQKEEQTNESQES